MLLKNIMIALVPILISGRKIAFQQEEYTGSRTNQYSDE